MKKKYVKKPTLIEAVQWKGTNLTEIRSFSRNVRCIYHEFVGASPVAAELVIPTPKGEMHAKVGDYIIKNARGEFYPCAREVFEETYDEVD